jgi:hypothetical protein
LLGVSCWYDRRVGVVEIQVATWIGGHCGHCVEVLLLVVVGVGGHLVDWCFFSVGGG